MKGTSGTAQMTQNHRPGKTACYASLFRIRFINSLQYRLAALGGCATQFFWGFMTILLFRAFYKADAAAFPMDFAALSSYIWLQQAFLSLFMPWYFDKDILESISSGNIAYELVRPVNLYTQWFVKNIAMRSSNALMRCIPIFLVAGFLPAPYGISLPPDIWQFFCFILSALMGALMVVAFVMLIYITTFYTTSSAGIRLAASCVAEFLSGGLVPLAFFPENIKTVVSLLPFASMQNLPLMIYSGSIHGREMFLAMAVQGGWLIIFLTTGALWMKKALRKVVAQGG